MRELSNSPKELKESIRALESYTGLQSLDYTSLQSKITFSSNLYDASIHQVSTPEIWLLTAKTNSGDNSLIDMKYWYRVGDTDVMADPQMPTPTAPTVSVFHQPLAPLVKGQLQWELGVYSNLAGLPPPHDIYFKFIFKSTDNVSWTLVKL